MPGSMRLVDLVQRRVDEFLDAQDSALAGISPDLATIASACRDLLAGGKRFRARFCYWGWAAVATVADEVDPLDESAVHDTLPTVIDAAAALELFHAAALVHDDIMDHSDLRRGAPSLHRRFEALHAERGWRGSAPDYGTATALLVGDLLIGWSDDLFESGLARVPADAARAARTEFGLMRSEVTLGQYLDMLEESAWAEIDEEERLSRAHRVIVYKSAKYSVEAPLLIGASLAQASLAQLDALRGFGVPLGVAFQLRDDLLGVFGDSSVTGKPAGDDLRDGKRTVLVDLARRRLPAGTVRIIDELLGDPSLDEEQIAMLQTAFRDSGAVDEVEAIIDRNVRLAAEALAEASIARSARDALLTLANDVTRRRA
ncbi:MAG: polyprenyl synthetase family protein [Actinomycetales bacterium]|nr:polyprenyl synthetase family protein [Actinomycetales bacterium]